MVPSSKTESSENPLVTIVIPVYNGSKYMREAIDSAIAQSYDNIEIIVVNDGSTDNTEEIALSYGDRIRYFRKKNGGVATALNLALKKMTGEYFSWLSHDDVYEIDKVEKAVSFLQKNKKESENMIAYSDYCLIDSKSKLLTDVVINHSLVKDKRIYAIIRGLINGNSLLIPKKAFEIHGNFNEKLLCTQDYELWFRMSMSYKFLHIPKVTIRSRYHSGQSTFKNPRVETEGNKLWLMIIKSFKKNQQVKLNGSVYAFYWHFAKYLEKTPYREALEYCKKQMSREKPIDTENEIYITYSNNKIFTGNKIKKTVQLMRREGFLNTLGKIMSYLKK